MYYQKILVSNLMPLPCWGQSFLGVSNIIACIKFDKVSYYTIVMFIINTIQVLWLPWTFLKKYFSYVWKFMATNRTWLNKFKADEKTLFKNKTIATISNELKINQC